MNDARTYWDGIAGRYQRQTVICCHDFHYGPLLPGDREFGLLPRSLEGLRCLELGCGGAQNSVFLAGCGAKCVALDFSIRQLRHARQVAVAHPAAVDLVQANLEALPIHVGDDGFDLVHSTYALPFLEKPAQMICHGAALLRRQGLFLLTTAHPLSTAEWIKMDDEEFGVFVPDYFTLPEDRRTAPGGRGSISCRPVPISHVFRWLTDAGLEVLRLLEPRPLPLETMSDTEIRERIPYYSSAWHERYRELARVPFVAIFLARKRG